MDLCQSRLCLRKTAAIASVASNVMANIVQGAIVSVNSWMRATFWLAGAISFRRSAFTRVSGDGVGVGSVVGVGAGGCSAAACCCGAGVGAGAGLLCGFVAGAAAVAEAT